MYAFFHYCRRFGLLTMIIILGLIVLHAVAAGLKTIHRKIGSNREGKA